MPKKLEDDEFDDQFVFNDENLQVSIKINKNNTSIYSVLRIYMYINLEHVQDSAKINVFSAMSKKCVYVPFFFRGATINDEMHTLTYCKTD